MILYQGYKVTDCCSSVWLGLEEVYPGIASIVIDEAHVVPRTTKSWTPRASIADAHQRTRQERACLGDLGMRASDQIESSWLSSWLSSWHANASAFESLMERFGLPNELVLLEESAMVQYIP